MTDKQSNRHQEGFKQGLRARHVQMIALGGAIGTGLFYGSASAIQTAGPSILLAYIIGGFFIYLVVRALGEMSVADPATGSFSYYAYKYWSKRAGYISGWNYWFTYIMVAMSELTAVGAFINYWFPSIPKWVSALFFLIVITALNLSGVRVYGEIEYWFTGIKVVAVICMIVFGLTVIILGLNNNPELPDPNVANLWAEGFMPFGISGLLFSLVVVAFSFGGTELVGITAGEVQEPKRAISKAVNQVILRILIFYVLALAIILVIVPWTSIDGDFSPFVQIFDNIGIQGAAHILNFVIIVAAMSVYNSGLYSNGRMLCTLARQGNAPKYFAKVDRRGAPARGTLFSSALTLIAVVVVFLAPDDAFTYMLAITSFAIVISWIIIIITEYKFRRIVEGEQGRKLDFRLPGGNLTTGVASLFMLMIVVMMFFQEDYRLSVIVGLIWLVFLVVSSFLVRGQGEQSPQIGSPKTQ